MMLYASLDFHSCFPDKFHSGSLTFSRRQVLSIFSPIGNENVTTNDELTLLSHFPNINATKMLQLLSASHVHTQYTISEISKNLKCS